MMQEIIIDFSKFAPLFERLNAYGMNAYVHHTPVPVEYASIADFHDDIAARLNFPAHYGRNLDALNDCMREIPPGSVSFTIFYGGSGIPHKQQVTIAKILLGKN